MTKEEFQAALHRLDSLIQGFETLPFPAVQEQIFEMLQAVDLLHREALVRLIHFLREQGQAEMIERAAEDPVIYTLLLLYDLAPHNPALEAELAGQADAAGTNGRPQGQPAGGRQQETWIPLGNIQLAGQSSAALHAPEFKSVARLDELPPDAMLPVALGETRAIVINVDGDIYAIGEDCPGSDQSLLFGALEDDRLTCGWHGEVYDVRSGKCLDAAGRDDGPRLPIYPVRIANGEIQITTGVRPHKSRGSLRGTSDA